MATTISRGKIFTCWVEVDERRLQAMQRTPELIEGAMQAGAEYWQSKILPEHFKQDAHGKYDYAARNAKYLKQRNKAGKPDLVMSWSMKNDLLARASYKVMRTGVELRMTARVLNLVPNIAENSPDYYVKHGASNRSGRGSGVRSYPNLKREIKQITDAEQESVAALIAHLLEHGLGPSDGNREFEERGWIG